MNGTRSSWLLFVLIAAALLGGCTLMAGDVEHWPASAPALALMVAGKLANDRWKVVSWPMEFLMWSAVVLITSNLVYLHFKEM
jgi:hypothetical protein